MGKVMTEETVFTAYDIPYQTQRQDSVGQQLVELEAAAIRLGLYDAADVVRQRLERHSPKWERKTDV